MGRKLYIGVAAVTIVLAGVIAASAFGVSGLPAYNSGTTGGGLSNPQSATLSGARNGDLIVVSYSSDMAASYSVSDSLGNTYTTVGTTPYATGLRVAYTISTATGSDVITVHGGAYGSITAADVSGLKPSATLDVYSYNTQTCTAGAGGLSSGTATGALAGDYVVGVATDNGWSTLTGAGTGYIQRLQVASGLSDRIGQIYEDAVLPVTGDVEATFNVGTSGGSSHPCGAAVVAFKAANPPSGTTVTTTAAGTTVTVTNTVTTTVASGTVTVTDAAFSCGNTTVTTNTTTGGTEQPCSMLLDADTTARLDLTWWGIWALGGLTLVLIIAPLWTRAWKWWRD